MDQLKQPLLEHQQVVNNDLAATTGYAEASFLSQALFRWLNPLLAKGYSKTLLTDDVPMLAPQHRAAKQYENFCANWPKAKEPNSVRNCLVKTFSLQFSRCSFFMFCRLSVMFAGPLLIQSFIEVTAGVEKFPYERYFLVLVLLLAKAMEVEASHQYNFECQKLGMQVRSSLIAVVYRKGLRLSNLARQGHGVGQIVNYMSVDVQQMSDVVMQLNNIWLVPAQMLAAMVILVKVVGLSAIAGLLVLLNATVITYITAKALKVFQIEVFEGKDWRMKVTVEALNNMKIIKLQAWDKKFLKNIEIARNAEYRALSKYMYTTASTIFNLWLAPLACCVAMFGCCFLMGQELSPSVAFTTISTVRIMQEPLRLFPNTLIAISQALVSLDRLQKYLWSEELEAGQVLRLPFGSENAIVVQGASFRWNPDAETPTLSDINLQVRRGSLVAVVGRVGSGKSSILAALLGEVPKGTGTVNVSGTTAYVAQSAWIQNGTIQDNILFGKPMNKITYENALKKCALETDLRNMEFGDQTEIGERGVNLSGGQKQRIQLARAVYQNCDIYLLDDIFSAVDAHTGSELFRECILGALGGKTVVLVTHQMEFLPGADLILVMRGGRIVQSGHYEDLLKSKTDFEALVDAHSEALEKVVSSQETADHNNHVVNLMSTSSNVAEAIFNEYQVPASTPVGSPMSHTCPEISTNQLSFQKQLSMRKSSFHVHGDKKKSGRLIEEEEREIGRVSIGVYWLYLTKAYGGTLIILLLIVQTVWQILQLSGDYWVAYGASETNIQAKRFIIIYAALAFSCAICVLFRTLLVVAMGLITGQKFYSEMLMSIFRAPIAFFDTTPTGRILSRASTDQFQVDVYVPMFIGAVLAVGFQTLGILVVTCLITWQISLIMIPLSIIYYAYQNYYFATARELTRVDAITKAPVIQHFSETIAGFVTIRCFGQQERFIKVNLDSIDSNLKMDFHNNAAIEWVGLRMEFIGVLILCLSALSLVLLPSSVIKPELVGLSLTYSLNLNQCLFVVAWLFCTLESKMISVERTGQYLKLESEAELVIEKSRPHPDWPFKGTINLQNLQLRYRPNTPLVLKDITVTIPGGTKVGVVGRTGSGKSTLTLALFRLVEPSGGFILIDNINISTIGLNDLRSRLSIIPQDPTLFDGSIRTNMDPLGQHSDEEIWQALDESQLGPVVRELELKLDNPVVENGENWSLGQRQLFCLGRALLKRSRILVLDEATASVDAQTDALMQKIVREKFDNCTVVSIAHRIPSVLDSDDVLVLDNGTLKESGSPTVLLDNPHSLFASLVREYSARSTNPTH